VESKEESKVNKINEETVAIIQAYLEYTGEIVQSVLNKQGYSSEFKEIDDDLVIKPSELIDLINKVQNALVSADD
jgi:hypothetical protein